MSRDAPRARPKVQLVTEHWGREADEAAAVTRLVAGALARSADVEVVHLLPETSRRETAADSVFLVQRVPVEGARPLAAGVLRAALASFDGGRVVPESLHSVLEDYEGVAAGAEELITTGGADAIVIAGHHQPYDLGVLRGFGSAPARRIVFLPMLSDPRRLTDRPVAQLVELADVIGTLHPGETRAVTAAFPERARAVVPLDLALNLNRGATTQGLFGVGWFGRFVVAIRRFPADGPRFSRSVTHEILRSVLPRVSVAEVDGLRWRITDAENTVELPVNPTRVNLWRLMAHALVTVDLRPPGPLGREAIESMMLGTPVVVPDASAAMEHAAAAAGGLWYRNSGELLRAVSALMDGQLRYRLAAQGKQYATATHGQMGDFVSRITGLVLGATAA